MAGACPAIGAVSFRVRADFLRTEKCVLASDGPIRKLRLKAASSGASCSSSSASVLQAVVKDVAKKADASTSADMLKQLSYSFLHREESPARETEENVSDVRSGSGSATRSIPPVLPSGGDRIAGESYAAQLPWKEAALRNASVTGFKGPFNVQIMCGEEESGESIVRRFRRAVVDAGVIGESKRRQFRETKIDTIRRKQRLAALQRKKRTTSSTPHAWLGNTWKLSREDVKRVDHSKKKKKPRNSVNQRTPGPPKSKPREMDDDFWGGFQEGPPV